MLKLRCQLNLAPETADAYTRGHFVRQNLHDYSAVERDIAGDENARHTRTAQLLFQMVCVAERSLQLLP